MKTLTIPVLFTGALLLTACSETNHRPSALDSNFGLTVKQVMTAQIAHPQSAHPKPNAPNTMDGIAGVNMIGTYRSGFKVETQAPTVNIKNTGSGSNPSN